MKDLFENVVNQILLEFRDGATNEHSFISFVDDDPNKGIYIFHACHEKDRESIIQSGSRRIFVASNICASYGKGLYATYTLESAKLNCTRRGTNSSDGYLYGPRIVKGICRNNPKEFLIFDPNISERVYGREVNIIEQIKMILKKHPHTLSIVESNPSILQDMNYYFKRNTHTAQGAYQAAEFMDRIERNYKINIRKFIKGLIFSGGNDGNVIVIHDFSATEIIAYSKDGGSTFIPIDRNEWIHKELSHDYDLHHELGFQYDEYPTQGFTNGYATVIKNINGSKKYRILSKKAMEYQRKHGNPNADGRISDLFFDEVYGLSFSADGFIKVKYNGTDYLIYKSPRGYQVYDADENVYLCQLKDLEQFDNQKNVHNQLVLPQDDTDWDNLDLSGF